MNKQLLNIPYEAPMVEIVEVQVEQGFAVSTTVQDWNYGDSLGNHEAE